MHLLTSGLIILRPEVTWSKIQLSSDGLFDNLGRTWGGKTELVHSHSAQSMSILCVDFVVLYFL